MRECAQRIVGVGEHLLLRGRELAALGRSLGDAFESIAGHLERGLDPVVREVELGGSTFKTAGRWRSQSLQRVSGSRIWIGHDNWRTTY